MDIQDRLAKVENREDFVQFVSLLVEDLQQNSDRWANTTIEEYLNGLASWVEDMDGLITDPEDDFAETIDWGFIAFILFAGSRYE